MHTWVLSRAEKVADAMLLIGLGALIGALILGTAASRHPVIALIVEAEANAKGLTFTVICTHNGDEASHCMPSMESDHVW